MTLQGLQLPGAPQPRDLTLSLDDLAALEHDFLDLLVGLVQAQAAAIGAGPLASFAGLLGLREGGAVPALPVQDVVAHGASALTAWFESVVRDDTTRAAWLQELAGLLGGARDGGRGRVHARARPAARRRPRRYKQRRPLCDRGVRRGRGRRAERRRDRVGRGRSAEHRSRYPDRNRVADRNRRGRARPSRRRRGHCAAHRRSRGRPDGVRVPPRPEPQARAAPRRGRRVDRWPTADRPRPVVTGCHRAGCGHHRQPGRRRSDFAARPGRRRGQDPARAVAAAGVSCSPDARPRQVLAGSAGRGRELLAHAPHRARRHGTGSARGAARRRGRREPGRDRDQRHRHGERSVARDHRQPRRVASLGHGRRADDRDRRALRRRRPRSTLHSG